MNWNVWFSAIKIIYSRYTYDHVYENKLVLHVQKFKMETGMLKKQTSIADVVTLKALFQQ